MTNIYHANIDDFPCHSSADNYLGWFHFLAIGHKATMYMTEQVSVQ